LADLNIFDAADTVGVSHFTIRKWIGVGILHPAVANAKPVILREREVVECAEKKISKAKHARLDSMWADALAMET
jgi:predicted site-specific integrase-resolvase